MTREIPVPTVSDINRMFEGQPVWPGEASKVEH